MPIFTIIAAHPVEVAYHQLPRVEVRAYILEGSSLQAAYEHIKDAKDIVDATEVMGVELAELCLSPNTMLRRQEQLDQWEHWSRYVTCGDKNERPWTILASGTETFRQRIDREFAERHPQFA